MSDAAVKFTTLVVEDNKRLRDEAAGLRSKVHSLEQELIKVVGLVGGRVERTPGISRDDVMHGRRDPKFPQLRDPYLRRVYDYQNDWVSAWVLEEQVPTPAEEPQAA